MDTIQIPLLKRWKGREKMVLKKEGEEEDDVVQEALSASLPPWNNDNGTGMKTMNGQHKEGGKRGM